MAGSAFLFVGEGGADAERLDVLARFLRGELETLDEVEPRTVQSDEIPEGARGFGVATAGAIFVALGKSGALGVVIDVARRWLKGSPVPGRTIKIEIDGDTLELTGASDATEQLLVAHFVERHG